MIAADRSKRVNKQAPIDWPLRRIEAAHTNDLGAFGADPADTGKQVRIGTNLDAGSAGHACLPPCGRSSRSCAQSLPVH